jgi:hypothetical protein
MQQHHASCLQYCLRKMHAALDVGEQRLPVPSSRMAFHRLREVTAHVNPVCE